MGWTTCYPCHVRHWKKNGAVDRRAECDDILTWEEKDGNGAVTKRCHVLKSAMVGSVYYAAVRTDRTDGTPPKVWAAIFLTCGKYKDGTVWGYKDMDETCGPFYYDCPKAILDLLTPTSDEDALRWRAKCRERLASRRLPPVEIEGVTAYYKGGWVFSSDAYLRQSPGYNGIRYGRRCDRDSALFMFLKEYGTPEQKAEYKVKTGKEAA